MTAAQVENMTRKDLNRIAAACADCPHCDAENIIAPIHEITSVEEGVSIERELVCRRCSSILRLSPHTLRVRKRTLQEVEAHRILEATSED